VYKYKLLFSIYFSFNRGRKNYTDVRINVLWKNSMIKKIYIYNRFCAHRPVARGEEFRINDVVRSHNRKIITIPFIKIKYRRKGMLQ